jgi:4-hydroxyphenylpyruvate dioxygenase-like putative hemolysin
LNGLYACCFLFLQTYLEQNEGPGLQHLALKTHNVIATMRQMHARSRAGGFEFQAAPGPDYYQKVAQKVVSTKMVCVIFAHCLVVHGRGCL